MSLTARLPKGSKVVQLLRAMVSHKDNISIANENMGQRLKQAIDEDHIDPMALKAVLKEIRMANELKRQNYQRNVAHYRIIAEEAGLFGDIHAGDIAELGRVEEPEERPDQDALDRAVSGGIRELEQAAE